MEKSNSTLTSLGVSTKLSINSHRNKNNKVDKEWWELVNKSMMRPLTIDPMIQIIIFYRNQTDNKKY